MIQKNFIGQKLVSGRLLYTPWLVQGRYFSWWKSLGHRVVRWARPEDGDLPVSLNGDKEWAVPISKAVKGKADAVEAPPEEAASQIDDVGAEAASAEPVKRKRGRPRKHAVS